MNCPNCEHETTRVVDTKKSQIVERFRRCNACGYSFATIESIKCDPTWQAHANYTDEEVARILKKRHRNQKDLFNERP